MFLANLSLFKWSDAPQGSETASNSSRRCKQKQMVFENICNSIQWQIAENGSMDGGTGLQTDDIQFHFFLKITKAQGAMLNLNPVANKSE